MKGTQYITLPNGNKEIRELRFHADKVHQELNLMNLYPAAEQQAVGFFGGAITDAVGAILEAIPYEKAREILSAYYGPDGIGYRAIRTHLDSCDFATEQYCAMSDPEDKELRSFSIDHDKARIIPWIKLAYELAGEALPVMLSPWSPPTFMKTNRTRAGGGKLKKEYYGMWARYICRYIQEYRAEGIHVTAISIQNEPNAVQTWDSCIFSAEDEKQFLSCHLHPALVASGLEDIAVYIWDHNKERLYDRACSVIDETTDSKVQGIAFHWYSGDHFDALRLVRERYPDKLLTFSEGCIEYSRFDGNQLRNAQMYGHDMVGNFLAGMNNFVDWNICLDEKGGPNYANNLCEAPVFCNLKTYEIEYKLSFDYIAHFSKYIATGAVKIGSTVYSEKIEAVAFKNPDGKIVVVVLNRMEEDHQLTLRLKGQIADLTAAPNSISTIVIA